MKTFSTLLAAGLIAGSVFSQSQRLVLTEEFTQASCGPCAAANPAFNAILATNTNKTVSIKYQTSWPGVDPMNAQNPTDVQTRVTYYNVTGVPDGWQDGITNFYPGGYSQANIDAAYAVPSSFNINATHMFNTAMDSVYLSVIVTCSQNITMTTPRLRVGMVEETISFATPPGSNGEKDFYNVMRKMYPNAGGTTIGTSWTNAQTQTFNYAIAIPTYIYSKGQIGFVAWIQDDANKNVKQAAYSAPVALANDAGVTTITGIPAGSCSTTFTPTVTIKNFGTANLTSCNIKYKIDNAAVQTLPWTGNLAPNGTTTVTLPLQTTTMGGHTFTSYTENPNAGTDYNGLNNQTVTGFIVLSSTSVNAPLVEGFVPVTFPPTGWIRDNPDAGPTWTRVTNCGGFGNSANATKVDFYNSTSGNIDILYAPPVDLSAAIIPAELKFDVAHARYDNTYCDELEVEVSTDCGATWTSVYLKTCATLATAPNTTSAFTPTAAQWRAEVVNLNAFIGQNDVVVRFVGRSDFGNNCYLDNINITHAGAGVEEMGNVSSFNVYPNPFSDVTTFSINLNKADDVTIKVYNVVGEIVSSYAAGTMTTGENQIKFDGSSLSGGIYFVTVTAGAQTITKKITVSR